MSELEIQGSELKMQDKVSLAGMGILKFLRYIKSFKWVVDTARWIQDTGATIAESAFTLAIIYVIIYTFGHLLIAWIPTSITAVINQIVMIVFTVLPELVMIPIILTTSDHWNMANRTKDRKSYTWFIAYALLTCLFITLSLVLLASLQNGIQENTTQATGGVFILRCFSGLFYTVLQRLWDKRGKETYTSRFDQLTEAMRLLKENTTQALAELTKQKDAIIAKLQADYTGKLTLLTQQKDTMIANLQADANNEVQQLRRQIAELKYEIEKQNAVIVESKTYQTELLKAVNKSSETALAGYSEECINWLKRDHKTVSIEDITRYTGHSKRKIEGAINKGLLQTATRNKELITVSTLANWLQNTPPPDRNKDANTEPLLKLVNN